MQKQGKRSGGEGRGSALNAVLELLKGGGVAGGSTVLILTVCAGLISGGVLKEQYADGCVLASCVIGAFFGGVYAVRRLKTRPMPVGLTVGTILLLLLFSAGFLTCGKVCFQARAGEAVAACLIGGMISGLFCCNSGKKRRK